MFKLRAGKWLMPDMEGQFDTDQVSHAGEIVLYLDPEALEFHHAYFPG